MGRHGHEGHAGGLKEPEQAGFVAVAEGFSPTVPARLCHSCQIYNEPIGCVKREGRCP